MRAGGCAAHSSRSPGRKRAEPEVAAAAATLDAVGQEIKLHSPAWSRLLQEQSEPFALAQAQAELLRPNEQLIVYQIGPRASFVFLVAPQPGALQCFPLTVDAEAAAALGVPAGPLTDAGLRGLLSASAAPGDASSVAGLLLAFRGVGTLAPSSSAGSAPAPPSPAGGALDLEVRLYQLWRTLLPASAWTAMRRCHSVLVVPDGALHLLPFESLVVAAPGHGSPPRYWIDVGPVVRYAHSIATAVEFERRALAAAGRRERTSRAEGIVSVSDPAFAPEQTVGGAPIRRLPGTRAESAALAQAFHGATVQLLQGEFATERALRAAAPGARILHLATHGIVDEEQNPPFAALLLTPPPPGSLPASSGSTEGQSRSGRATGPGRAGHARGPDRGGDDASNDGVLRLSEVYDLNLDCDLAVLSACDTKLGKQVQGEGVFALSRAFQAAGARRTVASLWAVADESTALLMREYFQRIARAQARGGELDYARLLRDAKRRLRDDPRWSQPIFWAPFVLSGAR
jgi:CHAT domain-containing protein